MNVYRPRLYALIWLLAMAGIAWLGVGTLQRDWLETGFLALLPAAEQRPEVLQAIARQQAQLNRKLIFLTGADNSHQAQALAGQLKQSLEASGLFATVMLEVPQQRFGEQYQALFPYRYQLLDAALRQKLLDAPGTIARDNLALLYSPLGQLQAVGLERDPWLLFNRYFRGRPQGAFTLDHGVVTVRDEKRHWALLLGELHDQNLKLDKLEQLLALTENSRGQIEAKGGQLLATGMPLFTAHGSHNAQWEMSLIGAGSSLGVIALLLATFRSPRPLLLSGLAVAAGLFAAWSLSLQCFAKLHILTLVFGSSLIGVVVDYALHFFCDGIGLPHWTPRQGLRYVLPGIAFGLLTSLLGYAGLGLSPFPGLREIAVFSAIGLIVSWLTVVGLFPFLLTGFRLQRQSRMLRLSAYWQQHWPAWLLRHRVVLALALVAVIAGGLLQLTPRDDIRLLQSASAELLAADVKIKQLLPLGRDSQFFLVSGREPDDWQRNETNLLAHLDTLQQRQALSRYEGVSLGWPDAEQQRQNYALLQATLYQPAALASYMAQLGFSADAQAAEARQFVAAETKALTLNDWLNSLDEAKRSLWLGCDVTGCRSVVALNGIVDAQALAALQELPGVAWVDQVGSLSELFRAYRQRVTLLLAGVVTVLLLLLMRRLGVANACRVMAVPVLAILMALAVLGWRGELFSLFNVFALLLVLEAAVDYAVFFQMAGDEGGDKRDSTALAVTLSAMTTLLAYGLLAMSSTAIVHAFGVTLAVGIFTAVLVAPMVGYRRRPRVN